MQQLRKTNGKTGFNTCIDRTVCCNAINIASAIELYLQGEFRSMKPEIWNLLQNHKNGQFRYKYQIPESRCIVGRTCNSIAGNGRIVCMLYFLEPSESGTPKPREIKNSKIIHDLEIYQIWELVLLSRFYLLVSKGDQGPLFFN